MLIRVLTLSFSLNSMPLTPMSAERALRAALWHCRRCATTPKLDKIELRRSALHKNMRMRHFGYAAILHGVHAYRHVVARYAAARELLTECTAIRPRLTHAAHHYPMLPIILQSVGVLVQLETVTTLVENYTSDKSFSS